MTEIVLDAVGVLVLLFAVAMVAGLVTGRVKARSCCSLPAEQDRRLVDADDDPVAR